MEKHRNAPTGPKKFFLLKEEVGISNLRWYLTNNKIKHHFHIANT